MSGFLFTVVDYFHDPHGPSSSAISPPINLSTVVSTVFETTTSVATSSTSESDHDAFSRYWNDKLVPLYLVVLLFPLINFKSLTFFTKFNSLGIFKFAEVLQIFRCDFDYLHLLLCYLHVYRWRKFPWLSRWRSTLWPCNRVMQLWIWLYRPNSR